MRCKEGNGCVHLPSRLLEQAAGAVGHFFIHAALLLRVDVSAAEFLFGEVETCEYVSGADGGPRVERGGVLRRWGCG